MNGPDLHALQSGDRAAWDDAFAWLWPTAFAAAQTVLGPYLASAAKQAKAFVQEHTRP